MRRELEVCAHVERVQLRRDEAVERGRAREQALPGQPLLGCGVSPEPPAGQVERATDAPFRRCRSSWASGKSLATPTQRLAVPHWAGQSENVDRTSAR
jgi:hypothetical protein